MSYLTVALFAAGVLVGEFTPEEERFVDELANAMCAEHAKNWRTMQRLVDVLPQATDAQFREAVASFQRLRDAAPLAEFQAADRSCGTGVVRTLGQFDRIARERRQPR